MMNSVSEFLKFTGRGGIQNVSVTYSQKKKSIGVKSGDLGGHPFGLQ
jgi:hypothetical protein